MDVVVREFARQAGSAPFNRAHLAGQGKNPFALGLFKGDMTVEAGEEQLGQGSGAFNSG